MAKARRRRACDRFVSVQVRTHTDAKFRELSKLAPSGQALWLYLLTCPDNVPNVPGAVTAGRCALAEKLRWTLEEFDACFAELEVQGMAVADWDAQLIYLTSAPMQSTNQPTSPSHAVTRRRALENLPECALAERMLSDWRRAIAELGAAFSQSFDSGERRDKYKHNQVPRQPAAQSAAHQKQEQEHKQQQLQFHRGAETAAPPPPAEPSEKKATTKRQTDTQRVIATYCEKWVERWEPTDGKGKAVTGADADAARRVVEAYGVAAALAYVDRFMSDDYGPLVENRHPLSWLPKRIDVYRTHSSKPMAKNGAAPRRGFAAIGVPMFAEVPA